MRNSQNYDPSYGEMSLDTQQINVGFGTNVPSGMIIQGQAGSSSSPTKNTKSR